jgi:hypothetical protein
VPLTSGNAVGGISFGASPRVLFPTAGGGSVRTRVVGDLRPCEPLSRGATLAQEAIELLILVAYASKHGTTSEIAERIAQTLTAAGHQADVRPEEGHY